MRIDNTSTEHDTQDTPDIDGEGRLKFLTDLLRKWIEEDEKSCPVCPAALAFYKATLRAATDPDDETSSDDEVIYRCFSDITSKPLRWLWPGRVARGKLTIFGGHPDLGKSQVTLSMAAIVTTGGIWPVDGTQCEKGSVIILSAEDNAEDTIKSRLRAAGADINRVYSVDAIRSEPDSDGAKRSFNLSTDLERLKAMANKIGDVAMISIDPASAYMGNIDSSRPAAWRAVLTPLAEMAAEIGVAVVCVEHLTKSGGIEALMRVLGSVAFVGTARAAYLVAQDPEDEDRRLFLQMKSNLAKGKKREGLAYRVKTCILPSGIETSRVEWDADLVTITANEVMARNEESGSKKKSKKEDAQRFLQEILSPGDMGAKEVRIKTEKAGYSWRTVEQAKKDLGVVSKPKEGGGGWVWSLPKDAGESKAWKTSPSVLDAYYAGRSRARWFPRHPIKPPVWAVSLENKG